MMFPVRTVTRAFALKDTKIVCSWLHQSLWLMLLVNYLILPLLALLLLSRSLTLAGNALSEAEPHKLYLLKTEPPVIHFQAAAWEREMNCSTTQLLSANE